MLMDDRAKQMYEVFFDKNKCMKLKVALAFSKNTKQGRHSLDKNKKTLLLMSPPPSAIHVMEFDFIILML